MVHIAGRTVLVTGASRGLGRELVRQVLGRGAARVYAAARDPRTVDEHDPQVDTDLTAGSTAPKSNPAVIVRRILDGVEAGAVEVIADDLSREVRRFLPDPIEAQLARFAPHAG